MSGYSPPSPPTPSTPDLEAKREAQRRAEEDRERKKIYIKLILVGLNKFPNNEPLIVFLRVY